MCIVYICFALFAFGFSWIITVVSFYLDRRSAGFLFFWAASQDVSQAVSQDVKLAGCRAGTGSFAGGISLRPGGCSVESEA